MTVNSTLQYTCFFLKVFNVIGGKGPLIHFDGR